MPGAGAARAVRTAYAAGWAWLLAAIVAFLHGTFDAFSWGALLVGTSAATAALVRTAVLVLAAPNQLGTALMVLAWPAASGAEMLRVVAGATTPAPATLVASALVVMELLAAVAFTTGSPALPVQPRRDAARVAAPAPVEAPRKRISAANAIT